MRKFMLGTDWWPDCDDAVAVRLIIRAIKEKEKQIKRALLLQCTFVYLYF